MFKVSGLFVAMVLGGIGSIAGPVAERKAEACTYAYDPWIGDCYCAGGKNTYCTIMRNGYGWWCENNQSCQGGGGTGES